MSTTSSVIGFVDFDNLLRTNIPGYSHRLTKLFDVCSDNKDVRHPISFREASERLIKACDDTLMELQIEGKEVEEFVIGKSFVKERRGATFRPDVPTTWRLDGGVNGRWKSEYLPRDYNGLVVLGCVERELIPIASRELGFKYSVSEKEDNNGMSNTKSFSVDQQLYALGLEQSLVHHYMFVKPDKRLRNHSLDCGRKSDTYRGGVVYVAFKVKEYEDFEQNVTVSNILYLAQI